MSFSILPTNDILPLILDHLDEKNTFNVLMTCKELVGGFVGRDWFSRFTPIQKLAFVLQDILFFGSDDFQNVKIQLYDSNGELMVRISKEYYVLYDMISLHKSSFFSSSSSLHDGNGPEFFQLYTTNKYKRTSSTSIYDMISHITEKKEKQNGSISGFKIICMCPVVLKHQHTNPAMSRLKARLASFLNVLD
jgi:hypothetical protein